SSFGILKYYFRENNRNILVTALGLIFIISIFSVTLTSEQVARYDFIDSKLGNNIEISILTKETSIFPSNFEGRVNNLKTKMSDKINTHDLSDMIFHDDLATALGRVEIMNETTTIPMDYKFVGALNLDISNQFISSSRFSGRFPSAPDEVMLVKGSYTNVFYEGDTQGFSLNNMINYNLDQVVNITSRDYENHTQLYNHNVTIVGIYDTSYFIKTHEYGFIESYLTDQLIINNPVIETNTFYAADHDSFKSIMNSLHIDELHTDVQTQFKLDLSDKIDSANFEILSTTIDTFLRDASWSSGMTLWRYQQLNTGNGYYKELIWQINEFSLIRMELGNTIFFSMLLMIPALSITILFSNFAANIFFGRRKSQIGLLRVRGFSRKQLLGVLIVEGLLSAITSLIIGYVLGLGLATLTASSRDFLDFKFALNPMIVAPGTFYAVLLWTIVIVGTIMISRTISLSKLDVIESRKPIKKEPLWRRSYLDIIFLVLGIAGNGFFLYLVFNNPFITMDGPMMIVIVILTLFFLPFPFFLLFGGLLTLSRLVPPTVNFVSKKIWHRFANIFSYSLSTMVRQKESAIRSILLVSLTFSMIWTLFTIPPVMDLNTTRTSYYSVGADSYYSHAWNETLEASFSNDNNIADFVPLGVLTLYTQPRLDVFIVFPQFLDVAYFEEGFGTSNAIEDLYSNNFNLMMNVKGLESGNREIGDNMTIKSNDGSISAEMIIMGSFNYWPRLITSTPTNDPWSFDSSKIIITNETFSEFIDTGIIDLDTTSVEEGYYFKLAKDADNDKLKETYGEELVFASEVIQDKQTTLSYQLLWIQLNVLFLVNMCTIVLTIILYGYRQVRGRARELSVERSLGMKQLQISRIFIYESLSILGFSFVFGTILGFLFSSSMVSIVIMTSMSYSIPPPLLFFPLETINGVIGLLILVGIVASIIPAIMARKQNISESLKVN
ncbi:MAG: FtsX-like permease family protein, partial [Candidatus Hodarchaeales archaeon]